MSRLLGVSSYIGRMEKLMGGQDMRLCEVHYIRSDGFTMNFRDDVRNYGRHQWDVRLEGGQLTGEQLTELRLVFTDPSYLQLHDIDPFNLYFAGRSGGWLVVDQDLSAEKINSISEMVRMYHRAPRAFYGSYVGAWPVDLLA